MTRPGTNMIRKICGRCSHMGRVCDLLCLTVDDIVRHVVDCPMNPSKFTLKPKPMEGKLEDDSDE